ncbi:hypothetical protein BDK51DRAFT_22099, partial [Blyttiomyces helicus]
KFYPDKSAATEKDPPLYLHVSAPTEESLKEALAQIDDLIEQANAPPPPPEMERRSSMGPGRDSGVRIKSPHQGRSYLPVKTPSFFSEKAFVGIEPDRTFNVRAKLVGPAGQYVKHIQQETGTKVQLKGRGSGYIEHQGTEAPEDLHIHVT